MGLVSYQDKEIGMLTFNYVCVTESTKSNVRFPPYHINWIFKLSPMGRRFHHYVRVLHEYSEKAIEKRRKQLLEEVEY